MTEVNMELIKYRDAGMRTYTYFWAIGQRVISPYFDSEDDAMKWKEEDATQRLDTNTTRPV
jgi:hypothetical protein